MSFKFGSTEYKSSTQMHDDIAFTFIGAGAEPDLETADYTLENFDHEVGEMETQWDMTSGSDAVRGYDRQEFRAAVQRLRDELAAKQDEDEAA